MKKVAILIPSYKRPDVLRQTLDGLYQNTTANEGYSVCIAVGLNKASDTENQLVDHYRELFRAKGITFHSISYDANLGKAKILNILFKVYTQGYDYIVTLDNDMVISKPWLYMISICDLVDYDIMGFSSSRFWAHLPLRDQCQSFKMGDHLFYAPHSIAGGMMLFHRGFLEKNEWTNLGGVYGRDDAEMCLRTVKKFVYHTDKDWLVHDPMNSSTPVLKIYEDKKKDLYKNGVTVFSEGWDE